MYDMNDLVSFVKLVECGYLTEAARALGVSKSTLSRRITHLEETVGQLLLLRQSNKMHVNEAGTTFYPHAKAILEAAQKAQEQVDHLKDVVSGSLNVGIYSGLIRSWFPKELLAFSEQYPDVQINLKSVRQFEEAKECDVTIWLGATHASHFKEEMIGRLTCSLYASKQYLSRHSLPISIDELESLEWVNMHHFYQPQGDIVLAHADDGTRVIKIAKSNVWTDQIAMQLESIVRAEGVGILPDYMVDMREKHHPGELIKVLPQWQLPPLPIYLLYPYGSQPKRALTFLHHFRKATKQILK